MIYPTEPVGTNQMKLMPAQRMNIKMSSVIHNQQCINPSTKIPTKLKGRAVIFDHLLNTSNFFSKFVVIVYIFIRTKDFRLLLNLFYIILFRPSLYVKASVQVWVPSK